MTVTILHQDRDFLYDTDIFKYYEVFKSPDGYYIYGHYEAEDEKIYLGSYDSMEKAKKVLKKIMTSLKYSENIELPANDDEKYWADEPTVAFEEVINHNPYLNNWKPGIK